MKLTELAKLPGVQPFTPVHEQPVVLPKHQEPPAWQLQCPVHEVTVHIYRGEAFRASCDAACAVGNTQGEAIGNLMLALAGLHPGPFPVQLL